MHNEYDVDAQRTTNILELKSEVTYTPVILTFLHINITTFCDYIEYGIYLDYVIVSSYFYIMYI